MDLPFKLAVNVCILLRKLKRDHDHCPCCGVEPGVYHHKDCFIMFLALDFWDEGRDFANWLLRRGKKFPPTWNPNVIHGGC